MKFLTRKPRVSGGITPTRLGRLHGEASRQVGGLARLFALALADAVLRRRISSAEEARRLKHMYVSTSRKQGTFLYLTARSLAAGRIVEFGTSFAVSTIYLAAALRDNGGGCVIGSEFEPTKAPKQGRTSWGRSGGPGRDSRRRRTRDA
jgi:hypothetical protein